MNFSMPGATSNIKLFKDQQQTILKNDKNNNKGSFEIYTKTCLGRSVEYCVTEQHALLINNINDIAFSFGI